MTQGQVRSEGSGPQSWPRARTRPGAGRVSRTPPDASTAGIDSTASTAGIDSTASQYSKYSKQKAKPEATQQTSLHRLNKPQ